jgi:hypothetical protein
MTIVDYRGEGSGSWGSSWECGNKQLLIAFPSLPEPEIPCLLTFNYFCQAAREEARNHEF